MHKLPDDAFLKIPEDRTFIRKRGGYKLPLEVSKPPHVLVGASRTFFVFSNDFVALPPRQIGISHKKSEALALYLNSDFAVYHQFLTSPEIKRPVATLKALLRLPVPFSDRDRGSLSDWVALYNTIDASGGGTNLFGESDIASVSLRPFLNEINKLAFESLKLDARLQASVQDLVHTKKYLVDGQVGEAAVRRPDDSDIDTYMSALQGELDSFLGEDVPARHRITAIRSDDAGMVELELAQNTSEAQTKTVFTTNESGSGVLSSILHGFREKRSQWVYFDRNVRLYRGSNTYLLKPMQRLHWTSSQAFADAQIVIAEIFCQGHSSVELTNR
ncbi:MAG: hypothetical protein ABSA39_17575 [Edaphobacter sp.]